MTHTKYKIHRGPYCVIIVTAYVLVILLEFQCMPSPYDDFKAKLLSDKPLDALDWPSDNPMLDKADMLESKIDPALLKNLKEYSEFIDIVKVIMRDDTFSVESSYLGKDTSSQEKQDLFKIASITKTMISALVYRLQEIGIWNVKSFLLDENLKPYLRGLNQKFADLHGITLEDLLCHRSGLRDYLLSFEDSTSDSTRLEGLRHAPHDKYLQKNKDYGKSPREFPIPFDVNDTRPDKSFYYSNTNYALIGHMLAHVDHSAIQAKFPDYEGENIADLLRYFVFKPCGMEDSFLHTDNGDQNIPWNKVHSGILLRDKDSGKGLSRDIRTFEDGGVIASIKDVTRFWNGLCRGAIFEKPDTFNAMVSERFSESEKIDPYIYYAAGIFVMTASDGTKIYHHTGDLPADHLESGFVSGLSGEGTAYASARTNTNAAELDFFEKEAKEITKCLRYKGTLEATDKLLVRAYRESSDTRDKLVPTLKNDSKKNKNDP